MPGASYQRINDVECVTANDVGDRDEWDSQRRYIRPPARCRKNLLGIAVVTPLTTVPGKSTKIDKRQTHPFVSLSRVRRIRLVSRRLDRRCASSYRVAFRFVAGDRGIRLFTRCLFTRRLFTCRLFTCRLPRPPEPPGRLNDNFASSHCQRRPRQWRRDRLPLPLPLPSQASGSLSESAP